MWFNFLIAALIIIIPLIWSTKSKGYGAFSSLLAAACALAAGGIAFAFWEPMAYMILGWGAGMSGFAGDLVQGSAFGLGLMFPYLVALLILRMAVDSFVKANLDLSETVNMIGGAAFGLVNAVITVGILAISIGFMRLPASMLGYSPIEERSGQAVYASKLWIPADLAVARLYGHLSEHAFGTSTPLARYHPDVHEAAGMQRMTFGSATRNTLRQADFELVASYSLSGSADELSKDTFLIDRLTGQPKKQQVIYPDGTSPSGDVSLIGYAIRFNSGAKEKTGNVIVTPGQVRLITVNDDGEAKAIHPIAVVAPPDATSTGLYRFRFDAPESFIASQGGGADVVFAFEFMVPRGFTPTSLLVKNYRIDLESHPKVAQPKVYANYESRDKAIVDGSIFTSMGVAVAGLAGPLDKTGSVRAERESGRFVGIEVGSNLPGTMIISKNNKGGLEINEEGMIERGEHQLEKAMTQERGLDRALRIERFATPRSTAIVKVTLSEGGTRTLFGRIVEAADTGLLPVLVDSRGAKYEPLGFVYEEGDKVRIRYSQGSPLRSLADMPALSRSKRDQSLTLIYAPTAGVKITSFALGNREAVSFGDGLEVR